MKELEKKFIRSGIKDIPSDLFIIKLIYSLPDHFDINTKILLNFVKEKLTWDILDMSFNDSGSVSKSYSTQYSSIKQILQLLQKEKSYS
jgi:hypothetical protein